VKVLFTTHVLEHPPAGGPQLRIENSIKALSKVCDMDIVYRCRGPMNLDAGSMAFYRAYCREFVAQEFGGVAANRWIRGAQRLLGADVERQAELILHHVERRKIGIVWFGYGNISYPLMKRIRQSRPDLRLVCDTDSVWSRYVLREIPYARGLRRWRIRRAGRNKEREERNWVDLCDITTAVSEVDAQYYRSIAADPARIRLFSNAIDLATYRDKAAPPAGFTHPALCLAGTFGGPHSPMHEAARWTIEQVLPRVRERVPEAHLFLIGNGSDRQFGSLGAPGVIATGKLASALPYLQNADISLVPLKFESGTRFKILEAGACGVPVVTTTLGAEGLPVVDGRHVLIADEPGAFADAVVRVLQDGELARHLAANCRELVARHFTVDSLAEQAREILSNLRNPGPGGQPD
jgi:polysaccharide biosynthesis protein PslH